MELILSKPLSSPLDQARQLIEQVAQTPFLIQEVPGNRAQNQYLLQVGERRFYVGDFIHQLLGHIKPNQSLEAITQALNQQNKDFQLAVTDVAEVVNEHIAQLFDDKSADKTTAVKNLFGLLNPDKIEFLVRPLAWLFYKPVFRVLFWATIAVNLFFFAILRMGIAAPTDFVYTSFEQNVLFFLIIIGFLVFHELGHAAASHHFGVPPGKIGFGIYFIFPAFYTDLTAVWSLDKKQRVVINLGGIYFQLLINLVLIALLIVYQHDEVLAYFLKKAILLNCIVSLYNLNPFFRFDGYWIYSDYFDIPNLRKQANAFILEVCRFLGFYLWDKRLTYNLKKFTAPPQYALMLYAVGYIWFMGLVWYHLLRFFGKTHIELFDLLSNIQQFKINSLAQWTTLLPMLFLVGMAWTTLYFIIRKIVIFRKSWQTIR